MTEPQVGIIMGSSSDWETMRHAADTLDQLGVPHERKIVSAHRTPRRLYDYAHSAKERGLKLVIAGAGGAAHLPGMTASMTSLSTSPTLTSGWMNATLGGAGCSECELTRQS